jgi:hypothetical protein
VTFLGEESKKEERRWKTNKKKGTERGARVTTSP